MTTVAYKAPFMVADSAVTVDDTANIGGVKKIFKLKGGAVVGFAGDLHETVELLELLQQTVAPSRAKLSKFKAAQAIIVRPDGTVWHIECDKGTVSHVQVYAKYHAIGSGRDFALGAMAAKRSAEAAVKAAAVHDTCTKLPIQKIKVGKNAAAKG